ncbi:4-hydroxy-3-methylbut-2-enyl diphosphate reductase [Kribbella antibiotica]|uniref:4-hydroxy-3-methylbut-2-enyl diphosphate reductase n=1 Tax=Kribbella antibiotica TaxID=190195 RepID=A0A4R4ZTK0_9ACTN|nr:4-hydroxy-3-methylbut-2-enyl diphosphate reductase [Kribbella antibiotica]TDD61656.1 4-hydroxy-3-methylbut-2-enyl diphosphate reductase [Kribbella antibiotica]
MMGKVLLAAPRGFCAGVDRAVDTVNEVLKRHGPPVYVRRQIVHNVHVVRELTGYGAVFVQELDEVPEGSVVVISAHGASPSVYKQAAERGLLVIDATCPLVAKVHREVVRFAQEGYEIALIGHSGHEEVEGTRGEAPGSIQTVATPQEAANLQAEDPDKLIWLSQTTLAVDEVVAVAEALRERFPHLTNPPSDDICYASQNRQEAVRAIAARCDLLLVVGSTNSSNSMRLVEVALRAGAHTAYLVDDADQVRDDWFEGVQVVGVTAGASAPESAVSGLLRALADRGYPEVEEVSVTQETLRFSLPPELRTGRDSPPTPTGAAFEGEAR